MGLLKEIINNGRPLKNINWEDVIDMKKAGCSAVEIATSLGISAPTFYNRYRTRFGKKFKITPVTMLNLI